MHTITIKSFPVHTHIEISVLSVLNRAFSDEVLFLPHKHDSAHHFLTLGYIILINRLQKCSVLLSTG